VLLSSDGATLMADMKQRRTGIGMLRRLWRFLAPHHGHLRWVTGLGLLTAALGLAMPYLTKVLVDDVLIAGGSVTLLLILAGALVLAQIINVVLSLLRDQLAYWVTARAIGDLRSQVLRALERLPISYYDQGDSGVIASRVSRDVDAMRYAMCHLWIDWVTEGSQVLVALIVMLTLAWSLTLIALVPLAIVLMLIPSLHRVVGDGYRRQRMEADRLAGRLTEILPAIRVVRLFRAHDRETRYCIARARAMSRARFFRVDLGWTSEAVYARAAQGFAPLIVWVLGGIQVLNGEMTVGTLVALIAYAGMVYGPMWQLINFSQALQEAIITGEKLFGIIDHPEAATTAAPRAAVKPSELRGEVTFRNVWFSYRKGEPVLKDVSLSVAPGEMIGLVGRTGAGKSTLLKLLCGFYRPDQGEILLDGIPLWDFDQEELLRFFGVVPQDSRLFAGSAGENIAYGRPEASPSEVVQAAIAANAHDFIARLPEAYDTQVGAGGGFLSGGEQQRLALARAVLCNPRILILDEPTASVDLETEEKIQQSLDRIIQGCTVFAIAHRLSTLRRANRLVVIDNGCIVEEGPHEELMRREDGQYRRMVELHRKLSEIRAIA